MKLKLLLCSLFFSLGNAVWANHACYQDTVEEHSFSYCITKLPQADESTVLYHFHGRGLSEKIWDDPTYYTEMMKKEWQATKVKPPVIVTVSFGKVWLLAPKGNAAKTGLREIFVNKAFTKIEAKLALTNAKRMLVGESMGGFNSIQLLGSGLFQKVAILCPIIYDLEYPFSFGTTWDFVNRTGMDYKIAFGLWRLSGDYVDSASDWKAISPLKIMQDLDPKTAPEIYLSCGSRDQYGNYEGTEKFLKLGQDKGLKINWFPLYARHCGIDVKSLSAFLGSAGTK